MPKRKPRVRRGNLTSHCWILPFASDVDRWVDGDTLLKEHLLKSANVLRVIDHGTHLKVSMRRGKPPVTRRLMRLRMRRVLDETTHQLDGRLWDFVTAARRRCIRLGTDPETAADVLVHYVWNMFRADLAIQPEEKWLADLALLRARINATVTDEQAHGWELQHIKPRGRHAKR